MIITGYIATEMITAIPLISRGTGLFIPFYAGMGALVSGWIRGERTFDDTWFTCWALFIAAFLASLHALSIVASHRRSQGHGAVQSRGLWHDTFLFIPVLIWAPLLIIGAILSLLR